MILCRMSVIFSFYTFMSLLDYYHIGQLQVIFVRPELNITQVEDETSDILLYRFYIGR